MKKTCITCIHQLCNDSKTVYVKKRGSFEEFHKCEVLSGPKGTVRVSDDHKACDKYEAYDATKLITIKTMTNEEIVAMAKKYERAVEYDIDNSFEFGFYVGASEQRKVDIDEAVKYIDEIVGTLTAIALRKFMEGQNVHNISR